MSKEVGELSYEEVDQVWKDCGASVSPANMRYEFSRAIQEKLASRCRAQGGNTSDNISQAAANKAAEEGGLPYAYHYEWASCITTDGPQGFKWVFEKEAPPEWAVQDGQARNVIPLFIAADRASRQVANKAEVEPIAHLRFWASQSWSGNGNHGVEHGEGLEVCQPGEVGDDGKPAFPVFATPPATTGASTVLTDERTAALVEARDAVGEFRKNIDIFSESKQDAALAALDGALHAIDALIGEVAAQAGQVAVPEYTFPTFEHWLASDIETAPNGLTQQEKTIGYARLAFNAGRSSPAKESK